MSIFKFVSIYVCTSTCLTIIGLYVWIMNMYKNSTVLNSKSANLDQFCAEPTGKLLTLFLSLHCTFHHVLYVWLNTFLINTSKFWQAQLPPPSPTVNGETSGEKMKLKFPASVPTAQVMSNNPEDFISPLLFLLFDR